MRAFGFRDGGVPLVFLVACGGASSGVSDSMSSHEGGLESADSGLGGGPGAQAIDSGLPSAAAFADVNVPGDFTQPVSLPPPATTIRGDATSLVGAWLEDYGGAPCTPRIGTCRQMVIQQDSGGAVHGVIRLVPMANASTPPQGPFPPATDPNVGYPPGVSPSDYFSLEANVAAGVDFRILDGVVGGGNFSFWFSSLDLWTGWCALQTPYARNVRGQGVYRCAPETATPANTDVGKLDLCSTATDTALCIDANGFSEPCVCLDDAGTYSGSLPGCGRSVCECSATECHADVRSGEENVSLAIEGTTLRGTIDDGVGASSSPITFLRVAQ
ncbi:MAG TPA: hypothetical protein VKU41_30580 [Polyangiaceae bacterium]|nr:hypothetical protein [Polyangiaceae bacterium]